MSDNNINNNGNNSNMNTPKLKQLVSLVEGLDGFDKVYSCGGGYELVGITFSYDGEESEEYLEDDYEPIPPIELDVDLSGVVYLNEIPVITGLDKDEVKEAFKYIGETDTFHYTEYEGKYYPHLVSMNEDGTVEDGVFINIGDDKYVQVG